MKNVLLLLALMFSISNSFSQTFSEATSATTLSPLVIVTRALESGTIITVAPFVSTNAAIQSRGVAGKEQMKDELVALNDDIVAGVVKNIDEVRQPALKELFLEISQDLEQMESINIKIESGSELNKIAAAVILSLLAE